ncbi:MAG TPA: hypothetical protein VH062_20135 [Polyangiaceae bacterium]|nr:hypothetical protein [Polyangiaceae bacterium]
MPKSWGNTRALHRTLLLGGALGCACTTVPGREETHTIGAHWASPLCRPKAGATNQLEFDLEALGDFPPSTDTHESLFTAQPLVVPPSTRGASVAASDGFSSFLGVGSAASDADIDVALWPDGAFCEIPLAQSGCDYLGGGTAYGVGVSSDGRTLLVVGGDVTLEGDPDRTRSVASSAAVLDLATAKVTCLPEGRGLQEGRAGATVTALGDELLVAGGVDPTEKDGVVGSAELFDPATHSFAPDAINLPRGRARHGAVTLASNEVLLVGGVNQNGPIADRGTLDAIASKSPFHREGLAELPAARVDPVVLRLSDDRVFIAGGTDGTAAETPLQDLVWLDASAKSIDAELPALACPDEQSGPTVTTTVGSAFAAMPGGAVLAVGGCTLPLDGTALKCDEHCDGVGCPSSEVFFIDRDGSVTCCGAGRASCSGIAPTDEPPPAFDHPTLVPGEGGRPWLVEGTTSRTLRPFDPWSGQFAVTSIGFDGNVATPVRADAGSFLFVDDCTAAPCDGASLHGFRFGLRGPYSQAIAPLLLADTIGVALDRPLSSAPAAGAAASQPYRAPSADGQQALFLTAGSELVLTDTTYQGFDLVIPVRSGRPPLVHLGERVFGDAKCPWPVTSPQPPFDAKVSRRGTTVTLSLGDRTDVCDGPDGRVTLALAAATELSLRSVSVTRVAE